MWKVRPARSLLEFAMLMAGGASMEFVCWIGRPRNGVRREGWA